MRPGRVLIGGVALSVLLLAGAAIAGFLLGRPPAQWLDEGSFIISKDTGEQYVVLRGGDDPLLQRVPNYVSAQLLLGDAELTPFTVRDKYIRTVQLGEDLGIEGAPAGPARRRASSSTTAGPRAPASGVGIKVAVQQTPDGRGPHRRRRSSSPARASSGSSPRPRAVGSQQGRAYRFPMPADQTAASTVGNRLGFGATPVEVDEEWLNLFPRAATPLEEDVVRRHRRGAGGALRRHPHRPLPLPHRRPPAVRHRALLPPRRRGARGALAVRRHGLRRRRPGRRPRSPTTSSRSSATTNYPAEWPSGLPTAVPTARCAACCTPQSGADARRQPGHQPDRCGRPGRGLAGPPRRRRRAQRRRLRPVRLRRRGRRRHPLRHRHQGREVRAARPAGARLHRLRRGRRRRWCRARGWSSSSRGCRCRPTARGGCRRTRRRADAEADSGS